MKYIFEVTINPGFKAEDYAEIWEAESKIIQREPGACGTRLHRCIGMPSKLVAIASWQSKEMRDAAFKRLEEHDELIMLRARHEKVVTFHLIGEFEEPDWIVLPDQQLVRDV